MNFNDPQVREAGARALRRMFWSLETTEKPLSCSQGVKNQELWLGEWDRIAAEIAPLLVNKRPTPDECDATLDGHEFSDRCSFCGVDAHDWFNRSGK